VYVDLYNNSFIIVVMIINAIYRAHLEYVQQLPYEAHIPNSRLISRKFIDKTRTSLHDHQAR